MTLSIIIPFTALPTADGEHRQRVWDYLRPRWEALGHELITPHPDGSMNPPDRHGEVHAPERAEPGERMLVVGVDQGSVDVEDHWARHLNIKCGLALRKVSP